MGLQLYVAADERELYIFVTQSFKVFEQVVFTKACEKSATARGRSEDPEQREEGGRNSFAHGDGPLPSEVAEAMTAGLRENMIEFEQLEETADR